MLPSSFQGTSSDFAKGVVITLAVVVTLMVMGLIFGALKIG